MIIKSRITFSDVFIAIAVLVIMRKVFLFSLPVDHGLLWDPSHLSLLPGPGVNNEI